MPNHVEAGLALKGPKYLCYCGDIMGAWTLGERCFCTEFWDHLKGLLGFDGLSFSNASRAKNET